MHLGGYGMINQLFWKDKKVLITGHTGFKGSWLALWLIKMGATVIGYALDPYTERDNFVVSNLSNKMIDIRGDILDRDKMRKAFDNNQPDIVFHMAAQPLVRKSYEYPVETYEINVMGTLNVLECIRESDSVKEAIMITTDKCYYNKEQIWGYRETDAFGGYDMYSSSKACAEILIDSYRNSFLNIKDYGRHRKIIASVRAGNVIGGGDWSVDRLIPDCIKALQEDKVIEIRSPKSVRPWQHVLDALSGYILLAEKLWDNPREYGEGWNFGPDFASFADVSTVVNKLIDIVGKGKVKEYKDLSNMHEANMLFLDTTKAKIKLGWQPKWDLDKAIEETVLWYEEEIKNKDMYAYTMNQIEQYINE